MAKKRKNINAKGRSLYDGSQYLSLGYNMLSSPNFLALNPAAVKVLVEIGRRHTGFNNGHIGASYDDMAKRLHMSKATVFRACEDLEYYGFIKLRKRGQFWGRKANEWEVTFIQSEGYHPTHDWKEAKPRLRKRPARSKIDPINEIINSPECIEQRRKKIKARYSNEM